MSETAGTWRTRLRRHAKCVAAGVLGLAAAFGSGVAVTNAQNDGHEQVTARTGNNRNQATTPPPEREQVAARAEEMERFIRATVLGVAVGEPDVQERFTFLAVRESFLEEVPPDTPLGRFAQHKRFDAAGERLLRKKLAEMVVEKADGPAVDPRVVALNNFAWPEGTFAKNMWGPSKDIQVPFNLYSVVAEKPGSEADICAVRRVDLQIAPGGRLSIASPFSSVSPLSATKVGAKTEKCPSEFRGPK